ncbi:MAG: DeoR family transcriptional regulator [Thermoanaerobaculia bacterium]
MDELHGPGLGASQRTLLDLLKRRGEATLAEVETGLDVARETVRSHLVSLTAQQLVERSGVRRQGPGRPQVLYRLSAKGEALFPRREGEMLAQLARYLLESEHPEQLEEFFVAHTQAKRARLASRLEGLPAGERLTEIAGSLSAEGYLAEAELADGQPVRLRLCHCPLRDLVAVTQLPCRAEMGLVEDLLGRPLERTQFMPDGAASCTYSVGAAVARREPAPAAGR